MSCYEWESGTLKLPTAEFTKLRKTIETADKARKQILFDRSQTFWKGLPAKAKRDADAYREAVREYCWPQAVSYSPGVVRMPLGAPAPDEALAEELHDLLQRMLTKRVKNPDHGVKAWQGETILVTCPPRRVLKADVAFPTNRTLEFSVGYDATITFNREASSVTWSVGENNHAVDHARSHPLANVFFTALGRITWTRGTGGVIVGNDEYNRHSESVGGGGNYVTASYGPAGKKVAGYAA